MARWYRFDTVVTESPKSVVRAGLYRHYKGNAYRVLFVAKWVWDGRSPTADAELLVIARPEPCVQLKSGSSGLYGKPLFTARWSSNTNDVGEGLPIVIYVALYGDGRVAARRLDEFEERVDAPSCADTDRRAPRFERIGD